LPTISGMYGIGALSARRAGDHHVGYAERGCGGGGAKLQIVADQVGGARHAVVLPNGDIIVALQAATGGVLVLRDANGDGVAEEKRKFGSGGYSGIAYFDGYLYAAVHGRDQLHDNFPALFTVEKSAENPGEEFVRVDRGADYGWPYCYYDVDRRALVLAPEYGGDGRRTGQCASKTAPLIAFPGHWAPESVLFYTGGQFPSQYRGGAFISFHGSWNRAPLPHEGFRVVFAPFRFNRPTGSYTTFADGFNPTHQEEGPGVRRPMGLAQGPDGSLYITDDAGGNIWKVTYRGTSR